jgi:hypothetical protein
VADTSGGGNGQTCGGIAGLQCPTGQTCQLDGNYPDAAGTCVGDLSGRPQICGGIAGLQCPAGQTCLLDGNYPDASGTCSAQ